MAVIPLNETYYEVIDSESPTRFVFTDRDSSAFVTFLIKQDQIIQFIEDVLGYAVLKNNTYVDRPKIPASHPLFPWMYAYGIQDIKGVSNDGRQSSVTLSNQTTYKNLDTNKPDYTGSYLYYRVTVKFQTREYAIYDNEQLAPYRQDNAKTYIPYRRRNEFEGEWLEREEIFVNRCEYTRFTNWTWMPDIQYLTFGGGNYWMKLGPEQQAGGIAELPISMEQGGTNLLKIVRAKVNINWFQVPFDWAVNNEILTDAYSKINYETFLIFPKGSLLFTECEIKKYDPTYPFINVDLTVNSSVYDYYTQYNQNLYCDVTFKTIFTNYADGMKPTTNPQLYFPLQCRDVNSIHNRMIAPANRLWYYVDSKPAIPVDNQDGVQVGWTPDRTASPVYWNYNFKNLWNYREGA